MQYIGSRQNETVRGLRALKDAKARNGTGLFLVEGRKLCEEALRDGSVETLLVHDQKADAYGTMLRGVKNAMIAPAHVVASVCETKTPQGIVAAVRFPAPLSLCGATGPLLALDGVQDPGNVGAILRTAEAAGFRGALLSEDCSDPFSPKAVRASMGSVLRLPVLRGALHAPLTALKADGFRLLSAELNGSPPDRRITGRPVILVIGGEGRGVSGEISALADARVALPMRGRAESLNAAVAAGIFMYWLTMGMPCN